MQIEDIKQELTKDLENVTDLKLLTDLKVKYLGKKGLISELNSQIKNIPQEHYLQLLIMKLKPN